MGFHSRCMYMAKKPEATTAAMYVSSVRSVVPRIHVPFGKCLTQNLWAAKKRVSMLISRVTLKVTQNGSPSVVTTGFSSIRPIFKPTAVLKASSSVKTVKAVRSARYIVFELEFL